MPSNRPVTHYYFARGGSRVFNFLIKKATIKQTAPALNHNHLKPKWPASSDPPRGPSVCAADHAIVYKAAY